MDQESTDTQTAGVETSHLESADAASQSETSEADVAKTSATSTKASTTLSPARKRKAQIPARDPVRVNLKTLMESGIHFGHQTERWCPKMMPYIYGARNNVHVINLDYTMELWEKARKAIVEIAQRGGTCLFVGTKKQTRSVIETAALECDSYYVTSRWLGGALTNFETIKKSIDRMEKLESLLEKANMEVPEIRLNKKERLMIQRDLEKLEANLGGIRDMKKVPDLLFVVDIGKESIAIAEARSLHIPVVGLVDTNVDPKFINYPIPANDDSVKGVKLFASAVADAVNEGHRAYASRYNRPSQSDGNNGPSRVVSDVKEVPRSKKGGDADEDRRSRANAG
ncbi:MAG: 30S ribosomal protein S2 [Bdellovibrionales bacterium]|nr:30S ribosomal protein S2 [Bdellovibrionales bacterium]